MAQPVVTYLCLGGNLGDRLAALTGALTMLDAHHAMRMVSCSSIYETEPWAVADQPNFLNLVAGFETTLSPVDLLALCKDVEAQIGRTESYRWGPRLIDVDILLYGDQVISIPDPDLQIPHVRMHERAFALVPLAEIASDTEVPPAGTTVPTLTEAVDGKDGVVRWGSAPSL